MGTELESLIRLDKTSSRAIHVHPRRDYGNSEGYPRILGRYHEVDGALSSSWKIDP